MATDPTINITTQEDLDDYMAQVTTILGQYKKMTPQEKDKVYTGPLCDVETIFADTLPIYNIIYQLCSQILKNNSVK